MQYFTLSDLLTQLDRELDLTQEDGTGGDQFSFITREEKIDYINKGVHEAEREIHKLSLEDTYFRAKTYIPVSEGQQNYDLPSNIFGNKILRIMYAVDSVIYEILRLRRTRNMTIEEEIAYIEQYGQQLNYQYLLRNDGDVSVDAPFRWELWFYPNLRITSETAVTIWYIRQANVLNQDDDICDIPEFSDFIVQFAKVKCLEKEFLMQGPPEYQVQKLEQLRQSMIATLTEMVPDEHNQIAQDVSFYEDFDNPWFGYGFGGNW